MGNRFFVERPIRLAEPAVLIGGEAHHLAHVMRASPGDQLTLFDGSGDEFTGRVVRISRSEVQLEVVERRAVSREAALQIVLGAALPKGDRQRWLVEKATELGVARLVPLRTERGVAQPQDNALQRLQRAVVEASKQCGRNRLLQVDGPLACEQFLSQAPPEEVRWFAHPQATARAPTAVAGRRVWIAVGPEGGFSESEQSAAAAAGWSCVTLGASILRVETAALALAAHAVLTARAEH